MPNILDVFNTDAFNVVSLTHTFNKLPWTPQRIGQMGLFTPQGITTKTATIEALEGVLSLIPAKNRGAPGSAMKPSKRTIRTLQIPHLPLDDSLLAADLFGVRAFGGEANTLQSVTTVLNDKLQELRNRHEITLEHMRAGALAGIVYDADGTTALTNLFTIFGVTQKSVDFVFGTATTNMQSKCFAVHDAVRDALGATSFTCIHVLAGATWFRNFIAHAIVKTAYERWMDGAFLRDDLRAKGFPFAGLFFEEYRGGLGDRDFIVQTEARAFPLGVPGLFKTYFAPGVGLDAIGTIGQPFYVSQERMNHNKGISIATESNPLPVCHRPECLVRLHTSTTA